MVLKDQLAALPAGRTWASLQTFHGLVLMAAMKAMRILLIDDHAIFRRGLRMLLCEAHPTTQIDEAESIEQAMAPGRASPDLILLDINLPGTSGLDGITLLKQRWNTTRVVVLSALAAPDAAREALASGAIGYIAKIEPPERVLERVAAALDSTMPAPPTPANGQLTPRQREVVDLLCEGLSNKLIARKLNLSENTVRRHVQDILNHFQVDSRAEAVCAARRRGLAA